MWSVREQPEMVPVPTRTTTHPLCLDYTQLLMSLQGEAQYIYLKSK
jgi:hypothetical protein